MCNLRNSTAVDGGDITCFAQISTLVGSSRQYNILFNFLQEQCHGVKRSGSHSWEGELRKASKHPHLDVRKEFNPERGGGSVNHCLGIGKQHSSVRSVPRQYQGGTNVNLWPPFTVAPMQQTAPCSTRGLVGHESLIHVVYEVLKHKFSKRAVSLPVLKIVNVVVLNFLRRTF